MRKNTCTDCLRSLFMTLSAVLIMNLAAFSQTTTFTYQGKLTDTGNPPTGTYQMEFSMYDALAGGTQIGATIPNNSVAVAQGIFTVRLDFGAAVFPGADRFLQIAVRRNAGESFVTLNPRQQISSSPYSIRTLSAAQADLALDSERLGGIEASEYVNASTVNSTFIRNSTTQQTANFNVSGNGTVGGMLQASSVRAQTPPGTYGLTQSDGATTVSSYVSASGGWFGTRSNSPLNFFTNDSSSPRMTIDATGNVGVGTLTPQAGVRLDVTGNSVFRTANGNVNVGTPNSETGVTITGTNRADFRFNGSTLKLVTGLGVGAPADTNGISINTAGNVGIGTTTPNTRLSLIGGTPWTSAGWTASMNLQNGAAFGWEANAFGERFGIGQSTGGLYFFRTRSAFGTTGMPASYDLQITNNGDLKQTRNKGGLVKAMISVDQNVAIVRCYNGVTESAGDCGYSVLRTAEGRYRVNFGFQVSDMFFSLTGVQGGIGGIEFFDANTVLVRMYAPLVGGYVDTPFHLIVY